MAQHEQYVKQHLSKLQYLHKGLTISEILRTLDTFRDLRPKYDTFVFSDSTRKGLLTLDGTIPVSFKGNSGKEILKRMQFELHVITFAKFLILIVAFRVFVVPFYMNSLESMLSSRATYNIPIGIWLFESYPLIPPMCYVRPTQDMMIRPSKHVDATGRVYLPYLHEWKYPDYDLIGLVQVMTIIFGENTPVFSRPSNQRHRMPQMMPPYLGSQPPPSQAPRLRYPTPME